MKEDISYKKLFLFKACRTVWFLRFKEMYNLRNVFFVLEVKYFSFKKRNMYLLFFWLAFLQAKFAEADGDEINRETWSTRAHKFTMASVITGICLIVLSILYFIVNVLYIFFTLKKRKRKGHCLPLLTSRTIFDMIEYL